MLRARHVAGAAGAWTDRLRALAGGRSSRRIVPSKGIHVFVARDRIPMDTGVLARTEKSVLFVIPWQGGWLIGDTDTPWRAGPDEPVATGADVDYLLAKANALLAEPLARDDVHGVTAGLRPLVARGGAQRHDADQPPARGRVAGRRGSRRSRAASTRPTGSWPPTSSTRPPGRWDDGAVASPRDVPLLGRRSRRRDRARCPRGPGAGARRPGAPLRRPREELVA